MTASPINQPHRIPIQLRFADTDAFGHLNNAVFATFAEVGRIRFWQDLLGRTVGPQDTAGMILARIALDFRLQVRLGDEVSVTTEVGRIGNSSVGLKQAVLLGEQVAVEIESVVVFFDYGQQKSVPVPADVRARLEELLAASA
jgi:acyl-CoA thioester hydrolase